MIKMVECPNCKKNFDDKFKFCPYCGTKQNDVVVEPEQVEIVHLQEPEIVQEEPEPIPVIVEQPQEPEDKKVESEPPSSSAQEETVESVQPYESKPTSKKWLWIIGVILLLGVIVGIGIYGVSRTGLTKDGVWTLGKCPQKIDGLSVELSMNDDYVQTVKITKDGKLLQELGGENEESFYEGSPMVFDNSMVYYVDANFDGYTDIFIGTGDDRTYNTILLWNSDKNLFERYGKNGDPSLMNPYFSPSEKAIYECGKNGFYDYGYSKSIWKDGELVEQESLEEIIIQEGFDYDSYNEGRDYKRSKKYALFDSNNKLIVETNEIDELPNKWAEIIKK